jgi:hypothetical protein
MSAVVSLLYGDATVNEVGSSRSLTYTSDDSDFYANSVTIPDGETHRFLFLAGIGDIDDGSYNRPDKAFEAVSDLVDATTWPADFTSFLSSEERDEVVNWMFTGASPSSGEYPGGYEVQITGDPTTPMGDGADITNVTLCGVAATILSQEANRVVVTAGAAAAPCGPGDVVVTSVSLGSTTFTNAFTYTKKAQTVTFGPYGDQDYRDTLSLAGTATSTLPVTFEVVSGPASITNGNQVVFSGVGDVTLQASQAGDTYWAAASASTTFTVGQIIETAAGSITWVDGDSYITEANLVLTNGTTHSYAFDNALRYSISGGTVSGSAEIYYSETYGMAIHAVTVQNSSGSGQTYTMRCYGEVGASYPYWNYTDSNGPYYAICSDKSSASSESTVPVVSFLYGDDRANSHGTSRSMSYGTGNDDHNFYMYNVDIADGETQRYLFLVGIGDIDDSEYNRADKAREAVLNLVGEPAAAWPADFTSFLTATEMTEVVNWTLAGPTPTYGEYGGGYTVRIAGVDIGSGSDITNVTLCGVAAASIDSQSATEVGITAGAATEPIGPGDVVIYSTSRGITTFTNAFTYTKNSQTITFGPYDDQHISGTIELSATASSGLPVTFSVVSGPGSITNGNVLSFTGTGTVTIRATQAGDTYWYAKTADDSLVVDDNPRTVAGKVVWTEDYYGNYLTEVTVTRTNGSYHGDGFYYQGALKYSISGGTVSTGADIHYSQTNAVAIHAIAVTNTSGSTQTYTMRCYGDVGSSSSTRWHYTSTNGAYYTISSDKSTPTVDGSDPVISFMYGDERIDGYGTSRSMPCSTYSDNHNFYASNVEIEDGEVHRYLFLVGAANIDDSESNRPDKALEAVTSLVASPSAWPDDFTSYLDDDALTEVVNWTFYGASPASGTYEGGYEVSITGQALGDGSDITSVTLCGVAATIESQSATEVVVTAAGVAAPVGPGDVVVTSTSLGSTTFTNGFTYTKKPQAISYTSYGDLNYQSTRTLEATASSGLPVSFSVVSGPAELTNGNELSFTTTGTVTLEISQPGNTYWAAATVSDTFTVDTYFRAAPGRIYWTDSGSYVSSVYFYEAEDSGYHYDAYDNALRYSVSGGTVSTEADIHYSEYYGMAIHSIAVSNATASNQTYMIRCYGDLGSDSGTYWHYASTNGAYYTVSSDRSTPTTEASDTVASFLYGDSSVDSVGSSCSMPYENSNDDHNFYLYDVEIAAGKTQRFLFLGGVGNIDDGDSNRPDMAFECVTNLIAAPVLWPLDFTDFLSADEQSEVINWALRGPSPASGSFQGSYAVRIAGENLGNGSDITSVALCGVAAPIQSQTAHQVVVTAAAGTAGVGDVVVSSTSQGTTTFANAFTYLTQMQVLTFAAIPNHNMTNAVTLSASASSGLPVTFSVLSGDASISEGNHLAFTGCGQVSVVATQAGTVNWEAASVTNTFYVTPDVTVSTSAGVATFRTASGDPVLVDPGIRLAGTHAGTLNASVVITSGKQDGDVLRGGGGSYIYTTGTLIFSDVTNIAELQSKLRQVVFDATSTDTTDRVLTITVGDDLDTAPSDSATRTVEISANAPRADFSYAPSRPSTSAPAVFTDASTDNGSIASWSWDFGDGQSSTAQNPSHQYTANGTYTVILTLTDNDGESSTASDRVQVEAPAPDMAVEGSGGSVPDGVAPSTAHGTAFGYVPVGTTNEQVFTIVNSGAAALNISSADLAGSGAALFEVSGMPSSVAVYGSGTFTVSYAPTAYAAVEAALTIASDDSGSPYVLNFSGSAFSISSASGAASGGNTVRLTTHTLGNGSDVTSVTVCGSAATLVDQGTNWVEVTLGASPDSDELVVGDVVVVSTSVGTTTVNDAYTYQPSGYIGTPTDGSFVWTNLSSGVNGYVQDIIVAANDDVYVAGEFTTAGGVSASQIARWDGEAWHALGSGIMTGSYAYPTDMAIGPNGDIYVAGRFGSAGGVSKTSYFTCWDGDEWVPMYDGFVNSIGRAIVVDENDSLFLSGAFSTFDDVSVRNAACRIGGTWYAMGSKTISDNGIFALARSTAGTIYAGGQFDTIGGVSFGSVAEWSGAEWLVMGNGYGFDSDVYGIHAHTDGNLYVGGSLETGEGVDTDGVTGWDGTNWFALGSGLNNKAYAFASGRDGELYAGGYFTTAGGRTVNRIAKWENETWSPLGSGMDNTVKALAVDSDGILYAGGSFTTAGGVSVSRIAMGWQTTVYVGGVTPNAVTTAGGLQVRISGAFLGNGSDITSVSLAGVPVTSIDEQGTNYVVVTAAAGTPRRGDVIVQSTNCGQTTKSDGFAYYTISSDNGSSTGGNTTRLTTGALGSGSDISSVTVAGSTATVTDQGTNWVEITLGRSPGPSTSITGDVVVVSASVGTNTIDSAYVYNPQGRIGTVTDGPRGWQPMAWGFDSSVNTIAVAPNGDVYAGGYFENAGDMPASLIARWDGTRWHALDTGMTGASSPHVDAIAAGPDGTIYVGGNFSSAAGVYGTYYFAAWDGQAWSDPVDGAINSIPYDITVDSNGDIYVVGSFSTFDGKSAARAVGRIDGTWSALGAGLNNWADSCTLGQDGKLYADGAFTTAGGVSASYIASWDGSNWSALGSGISSQGAGIHAHTDGNVYVAGNLSSAGGVSASHIAGWDGTNWFALGTGLSSTTYAMASGTNAELYVGGYFSNAGGSPASKVAMWDGNAWHAMGSGMDSSSSVTDMAVDTNSGVVYAGGSFTSADGDSRCSRIAKYAPTQVRVGGVTPGEVELNSSCQVAITGIGLGSGTDITNVTICGTSVVSIDSQSEHQVLVTVAASSTEQTGDVRVVSTSRGETVATDAFSYAATAPAYQTISDFLPADGASYHAAETVGLSATASSGLDVTFSVHSGPGSISGGTNLSFTAMGTVVVAADQAGSVSYAAAPTVLHSYTIGAAPTPEVAVLGNGVEIADGDTSPRTADYTGFGSVEVVDSSVDHTFTITNSGTATLTLTGTPRVAISGSHAGDFTVTAEPAASVDAGDSTTFTVRFDPTAVGTRVAIVEIENNDEGENPYDFQLSGESIKASQTISSFLPADGTILVVSDTVTLSATASSGLDVSFAVQSGPGTITAEALSFSGGGSVVVVASQAGNANYAAATSVTNTYVILETLSGSGSSDEPWTIDSVAAFSLFCGDTTYWSGHVRLDADLDLDGTTYTNAPIAPDTTPATGVYDGTAFTGVFDGNAHTISNFTMNSAGYHSGLFGKTLNATVSDLTVVGTLGTGADVDYVGGLVGYAERCTITNCRIDVDITGVNYSSHFGGMCGYLRQGSVVECSASGAISSSGFSVAGVGGLVGTASYATILRSYAIGSLTGARFANSYGGLCGRADGTTIADCYAQGNVTGGQQGDYLGGLCGKASSAGSISRCYSVGAVACGDYPGSNIGGLCGGLTQGAIQDSFWDMETSAQGTSSGGTGKTTDAMHTETTFTSASWDFGSEVVNGTNQVWSLEAGGYPQLSWTMPEQSISVFLPRDGEFFGVTASAPLAATATSGLSVQFAVLSGSGTISGTTLSFSGIGDVVVVAYQPGNASYGPAAVLTRTYPVGTFSVVRSRQDGEGVSLDLAARSGRTYLVYKRDNSLAGARALLSSDVATSDTLSIDDPNLVGDGVTARFYDVVEDDGGVLSTNPTTYAAYVTPTAPSRWYRLSMPIDLGASNRLDSTLGELLRTGAAGDALVGDLVYAMRSDASWQTYALGADNTWRVDTPTGAAATNALVSGQAFWMKRRSSGSSTNAVYTGPVITEGTPISFGSNTWQLIAWPFPTPRREDTGPNGWGFAAAGAQTGTSWMTADNVWVDGKLLWLNADGRWRKSDGSSAADMQLETMNGYYYLHRGSGFTWTPVGE